VRKIFVMMGFAAAFSAAHASPTGLFLMPIADILKHREGFAFAGLQGTEQNVSKGYSYFNAVTVGLFNHAEVGYDNDFLGHTTYNVKLQVFDNLKQLPGTALSVGVVNCTGSYREPYVVARHDFKDFRLHAGYWNTQGCGRMVVGADFSAFKKCTGAIEFMSGPSSITWGSLFIPIDAIPGLGIDLAVGFPSDRHEGIQHSALLYYSFKL
jgi:hypothetical protein